MSIELILGLVGTVTGILGLIVHIIKFRRERPHLKVEVIECTHEFNQKWEPGDWKAIFHPSFRILNQGDRSTTVSKIELSFVINDKEFYTYQDHSKYYKPIDAHETVEVTAPLYIYSQTDEQGSIQCRFTIHHTHGKQIIECTSEWIL